MFPHTAWADICTVSEAGNCLRYTEYHYQAIPVLVGIINYSNLWLIAPRAWHTLRSTLQPRASFRVTQARNCTVIEASNCLHPQTTPVLLLAMSEAAAVAARIEAQLSVLAARIVAATARPATEAADLATRIQSENGCG